MSMTQAVNCLSTLQIPPSIDYTPPVISSQALHNIAIVSSTTTVTTPPPQPFHGPVSGTTRVSRCHKKASSGLYGAREDNKRQTHRQSGWTPLHPDQSTIHPHKYAPFYAGCSSCRNTQNLSWLGTGTGICRIAYPRGLV